MARPKSIDAKINEEFKRITGGPKPERKRKKGRKVHERTARERRAAVKLRRLARNLANDE